VHEQNPEQALERQVEELEHDSEQLGDQIEETREDWESKQADESVPGAVGGEAEDEPAQSIQSERGESADEAGQ
jgi:hypothetical protein